MRHLPRILLALAIFAAARSAGATTAQDLCPNALPTCVIPADNLDKTFTDPDTTLDFGDRPVTIRQGRKLDAVAGTLTIFARTLTLEPAAALFARGATDGAGLRGGVITVHTTGDVQLQSNSTGRARVDVSATQLAGTITFDVGGNLVVSGAVWAQGTTSDASGGAINVTAAGSVTIGDKGEMSVFSGTLSAGGDLSVTSGGGIVISGPVDAHGGDGGTIVFQSDDGISVTDPPNHTSFDVTATQPFGDGGSVTLIAGGNITVGGQVNAQGIGSSLDGGSTGGDVNISADGSVTLAAQMNMYGSSPDGEGGNAEIIAKTDITQTGAMILRGRGSQGTGGSVSFNAGRDLTVGTIDVGGSLFGAGDVTAMTTSGSLLANGEINADGEGGIGGTIILTAETLNVTGNLHAAGPAAGNGGSTLLASCTMDIGPTGKLNTRPGPDPLGTNTLQASGQMTLANGSSLLAGTTNQLEYRRGLLPIRSGTIDPPPVLVEKNTLRRCAGEPTPLCGNGVQDIGEDCDDGNTTSCDGCSAECQKEPGFACGDGTVNFACGEVCDDGNNVGCDGCAADCKRPDRVCGDGTKECGEQCDDGNTTSCDGCSSLCRPDKRCGDGITECGEECDDGNTTRGDGCEDCRIVALPSCGNGVKDVGEECDDGNLKDCDGCSHTCHRDGICGDNVTDCRETCDDANRSGCDGCSPSCQLERCGNGIPDCGELCDDGNGVNGDGCDNNCTPTACGNGIKTAGEQCDDGNLSPGDGCDGSCRIERPCPDGQPGFCTPCETDIDCDTRGQCAGAKCANHICTTVPPVNPTCDDGRRDTLDHCEPEGGSSAVCHHDCLQNTACDDGNKCNGDETCNNGTCAGGTTPNCDDGNACTNDSCVAATGCAFAAKPGIAGADCQLDNIETAIAGAGPSDLSAPTAKKIGKALLGAGTKFTCARTFESQSNKKKEKKCLTAAKKRFQALEKLIGTAEVKRKISGDLADRLVGYTGGATGSLEDIIAGLQTP